MNGRQNASFSPGDRLYTALTRAAVSMGRLDQRLHAHPLIAAILFRERLEAARVCAEMDGYLIDPWHLAAELEGLHPRLTGDDALERGRSIDSAHVAFEQYQWLARPTATQASAIDAASAFLRAETASVGPLLGAACAFHRWIDAGESRAPMRGAAIGLWQESGLLRTALPLTGARAFACETDWERSVWLPRFLTALAEEAEGMETRVTAIERQWRLARKQSGARRRNSCAQSAIDLIAAFPLVSATRLADMLDVSLKTAYVLLERFMAAGIVIEVTHRSARRLFALRGFEPLRETVQPPRTSVPGRKRGRPQHAFERDSSEGVESADRSDPAALSVPPPIADYEALEKALALTDEAIARVETLIRRHSFGKKTP